MSDEHSKYRETLAHAISYQNRDYMLGKEKDRHTRNERLTEEWDQNFLAKIMSLSITFVVLIERVTMSLTRNLPCNSLQLN